MSDPITELDIDQISGILHRPPMLLIDRRGDRPRYQRRRRQDGQRE